MPLAIMVDLGKCTGCRICEAACRSEDEEGGFRARVVPSHLNNDRFFYVFFACMQCDEPACVAVCPMSPKSIHKQEDGIVVIDKKTCTGCGYCVATCPYGAVELDPIRRTAVKCDFCVHRLRRGMLPACVEKCPTKALSFGEKKTLSERAQASDHEILNSRKEKLNSSILFSR
jgi:Fe-S-cluster-containing dehydrogenase component